MQINELEEKIKQANLDYYSKGESDISDDDYDRWILELKEKDPNNPLLNQVGDDATSENKIKLPISMGSQEKVRIGEADLSKLFPDNLEICAMAKLDGLSMLIEYDEDGNYQHLYTRGNGFEGQDISYRGSLMNFPKKLPKTIQTKKEKVYLCGEAVISEENYKLIKGNYKHRRNFVGGTLRPILSDEKYKEADKDVLYNCSLIDIVIWEFPNAETFGFSSLFNCLNLLREVGFKTTFHKLIKNDKMNDEWIEKLINFVKSEKYPYLCDGAVFKVDDIETFQKMGKEANGLNPKGSRAVKLSLDKQQGYVGTIDKIIWEFSKRGLLKPVVLLKEKLNFDGTEVSRASAANAKYVLENNWKTGTKVLLVRSGDVIPRIIETIESSDAEPINLPEICPYCGEPLHYTNTGTDLFCANPECSGIYAKQTIAFFSSMKLENVGEQTIEDLFYRGFNSIEKLLSISYDDIKALPGYQAKKALNISNKLNNCLKDIGLVELMTYSQCFQHESNSLSEKRLEIIVECLGEQNILNNLENKTDENGNIIKLSTSKLIDVNGMGENNISLFKEGYVKFKKLYQRIKQFVTIVPKRNILGKLTGMSFCFTQFRDKALETLIENNGGKVGGLTKKTTTLFFAGNSGKMKKAEEYGIERIPQMQAKDYILGLLK